MQSVHLLINFSVSYFVISGMAYNYSFLVTGVTASPKKTTVTALNNVTLTCTSTLLIGEPDGYSWHHVDGDIPPHSSGQNSSILTIHRITSADEGEYYCMATQYGHCAKSNLAKVLVYGKKTVSYSYSIAI